MKTEKEKMIAGELYFSADPELVADRKAAREQMALINDREISNETRKHLLQETFGTTNGNLYMEPNVHFDYGYNIHVGKNFYANFNTVLLDICPITFGDNCMLGPNCQVLTASHPLNPVKRNSGLEDGKAITVGDNAWFGGGVILIPGVTLGNNVVVAAGSVVTKSFGDNVVIGGNPARIIKTIDEEETAPQDLSVPRRKINQIDAEITALLEKRMAAVQQVVEIKAQQGLAILDDSREQVVLDAVAKGVKEPAYRETIVNSFKDIMTRSREYQAAKLKEE